MSSSVNNYNYDIKYYTDTSLWYEKQSFFTGLFQALA